MVGPESFVFEELLGLSLASTTRTPRHSAHRYCCSKSVRVDSGLAGMRFTVLATRYKGLSLDCSYSLPTYSPSTPMLMSRLPPIMQRVTIRDVQPVTVYQCSMCARTARAASIKPKTVTMSPTKVLIRSGRMENEVAAVHAKESILRKGYLLSPAALGLRS